jgi:hypothetical protein
LDHYTIDLSNNTRLSTRRHLLKKQVKRRRIQIESADLQPAFAGRAEQLSLHQSWLQPMQQQHTQQQHREEPLRRQQQRVLRREWDSPANAHECQRVNVAHDPVFASMDEFVTT